MSTQCYCPGAEDQICLAHSITSGLQNLQQRCAFGVAGEPSGLLLNDFSKELHSTLIISMCTL